MVQLILFLMGMLTPLSSAGVDMSPSEHSDGIASPAHHVVWNAMESNDGFESFAAFDTVNGISLLDSKEDVIQKKGMPLEQAADELLDCLELSYEDAVVGICDGVTNYVHIPYSAVSMTVNGKQVGLTQEQLYRAFGEPYFIAEDGEVFLRGHHAIKVYREKSTGALLGVDFFDELSS